MPIDPNIPLQVQSLKLESPVNQLAMMGEAMKIGEMNRSVEEQNRLNQYLQNADLSKPESRAELVKYGKTGLAYGKSLGEMEKTNVETKKAGADLISKNMDIMRERTKDLLQNTSNENYIAHMQEGVRDGLVSPENARRAVQIYTAIPADQRRAFINQNLAKAETIYQAEVTKRGQDLTDARAREGQNKPVFNAEAGGWVVPPKIGKDGSITAGGTVIPVAGMTTKTTEGEKQAAFNTKRLLGSATAISKQIEKNPEATAPGTWEAMQPTEGMANLSRSPERQIVASNYADLIDAALYLATGAAYNKEQLDAQRQAYLPVWSDTPENKAQKLEKTVDLINSAKIRAGKNWTPELDSAVSKLFPTVMGQSEPIPNPSPSANKGNRPSLNDIFNPKK